MEIEIKIREDPQNKVKYLNMSLTKYVQDLYEENYETLMNEIKELNKWRDIIPC